MPTYPYQTLSEEPFTVLLSDQLTPSRGYIDQRNPHSINSLTIGELGTEEVLVSAHDDGDVCVWYTRDLKRIALRYNVGLSAWGVALHKEKRLLAISANSHKITVFELAVGREEQNALDEWERRLEERNDEYAEGFCGRRKEKVAVSGSVRGRRTSMKRPSQHDSAESNSSDYEDGRWAPRRKSRKRRKEQPAVQEKGVKVLEGHTENIPNIPFLPDSSGRWLVGTSIDGMVILWDVHTQRMVERCKFGFML
jgi:WD40 repeat protein